MGTYEEAKVDYVGFMAWCEAHEGEVIKVFEDAPTDGMVSLWLAENCNYTKAKLLGYDGEILEATKFARILGYYLAKTKDFGIDVPEVFKED